MGAKNRDRKRIIVAKGDGKGALPTPHEQMMQMRQGMHQLLDKARKEQKALVLWPPPLLDAGRQPDPPGLVPRDEMLLLIQYRTVLLALLAKVMAGRPATLVPRAPDELPANEDGTPQYPPLTKQHGCWDCDHWIENERDCAKRDDHEEFHGAGMCAWHSQTRGPEDEGDGGAEHGGEPGEGEPQAAEEPPSDGEGVGPSMEEGVQQMEEGVQQAEAEEGEVR